MILIIRSSAALLQANTAQFQALKVLFHFLLVTGSPSQEFLQVKDHGLLQNSNKPCKKFQCLKTKKLARNLCWKLSPARVKLFKSELIHSTPALSFHILKPQLSPVQLLWMSGIYLQKKKWIKTVLTENVNVSQEINFQCTFYFKATPW